MMSHENTAAPRGHWRFTVSSDKSLAFTHRLSTDFVDTSASGRTYPHQVHGANFRIAHDVTGIESEIFYSGGVRARILLRYWLGVAPIRRAKERRIAAALANPQAVAICSSPRSVRSS